MERLAWHRPGASRTEAEWQTKPGTEEGMVALLVGAESSIGPVRKRNEDAVLLTDPLDPRVSAFGYVAAVADGVGGHTRGDVASKLAVAALFAEFYSGAAPAVEGVPARLHRGFTAANARIYAAGAQDPAERRMGTTLVAAAIAGDQLTVANVGDSRAYLVRDGAAAQLTRDHTVVEQPETDPAAGHTGRAGRLRTLLARALGLQWQIEVDIVAFRLRPADRIIICTDGVHGRVRPEEFAGLSADHDPGRACRALVELASSRGATDNMSAVILAFMP